MVSHKHGLTVSMTPKRGLHVYFTKKPSRYNNCIADRLRHSVKGKSRSEIKKAFVDAVVACKKSSR